MEISLTFKDALEIYNNSRKTVKQKPTKDGFRSAVLKNLFSELEILDDDMLNKCTKRI